MSDDTKQTTAPNPAFDTLGALAIPQHLVEQAISDYEGPAWQSLPAPGRRVAAMRWAMANFLAGMRQ